VQRLWQAYALPRTRCLHTHTHTLQAKLTVADRHIVRCTADETRAISPPGLQARLLRASAAAAAAAGGACRCFVRPSGTEDAVRVYAEAPTQAAADALALTALQVCSIV
jgi:phosphoacetylglucosamine mutase